MVIEELRSSVSAGAAFTMTPGRGVVERLNKPSLGRNLSEWSRLHEEGAAFFHLLTLSAGCWSYILVTIGKIGAGRFEELPS
jgi:hypothetical protein